MNALHLSKTGVLAITAALAVGRGAEAQSVVEYSTTQAAEQVEVLTRGPVHEAFAETITYDPEPGFEIRKAPPEPIEEMPPDQRPEGANVSWIPGYWAWDDERDDFLWISGAWRSLPPGRQWMSGYWARSPIGYRWVSGYWADAASSEIEYLPPPPESIEVGPSMAAPSPDDIWLPGSWIWLEGRYVWRPGYWEDAQPDWVWVPDHYVSTPRGYVFVDGYWDYSISRRGVLFAPVYFRDHHHHLHHGHAFSPTVALNIDVFTDHLFVRPRYHHYYFGDYYSVGYFDSGIYPQFAYQRHKHGYDPIYVHDRWRHRHDRDWDIHVEANFQKRRDHEYERPPRSWTAQVSLGSGDAESKRSSRIIAAPLEQLAKNNNAPVRFQKLDSDERRKLGEREKEVQRFRQERREIDTRSLESPGENRDRSEPLRVNRPRSPIVGKRADELAQERVPPPRSQRAARPDPSAQPRPKKSDGKRDSSRGESKGKKEKEKP